MGVVTIRKRTNAIKSETMVLRAFKDNKKQIISVEFIKCWTDQKGDLFLVDNPNENDSDSENKLPLHHSKLGQRNDL